MWFRSSKCDSNACLEAHFRKSRYSENGHCVEAAYQGVILVRDSKHPDIVVSFDSASWTSFLDGIKSGVMERRSFA